jgi:hypothetical protein
MRRGKGSARRIVGAFAAALVALAVLAPVASAKPPAAEFWGLQTAGMLFSDGLNAPADELAAMQNLGIHTVRINFEWARIQEVDGSCAPKGLPKWSVYENVVRAAAEHEIQILGDITGRRSAACGGAATGFPALGSSEYEGFVKTGGWAYELAAHFGVGGSLWSKYPTLAGYAIKNWEVWNEPNLPPNNPSGVVEPQRYAKFLIDSSKAIKAAQPGANVLTAGLAGTSKETEELKSDVVSYLNRIYKEPTTSGPGAYTAAEFSNSFSGLSYHPYAQGENHAAGVHAQQVYEKLLAAHNAIDSHASEKTLWATEVGWGVGFFGETQTNQADDLWETLNKLSTEADSLRLKYVGFYAFQDFGAGGSWAERSGLRELSGAQRPAWCAYSRVIGTNRCFYVPISPAAVTATNITEPVPHNGQPGTVSATGTVKVTNYAGEVMGAPQVVNVNFSKFEGGNWVYKNTDQVGISNGSYAVNEWKVGVGKWRLQAVFPTQGANNRLLASETGWHEFTINATTGFNTESFLTTGVITNGNPGYASASGNIVVPDPEGGVLNGQVVNVNFAKFEGGAWVYKNTDQVGISNGAYYVPAWTVGVGSWRVKVVFPAQGAYHESESGWHEFSIAGAAAGWGSDNLGGTFTADPDISSRETGELDVFGRGVENSLWIDSWPTASGWSGWQYMGGALTSGPGATSWASNRIDVVMKDGANTVSHWYWQAGGGWAADNLGGPITSDPDISDWGPGRLDVFARGADGGLLHKYWGGAGWSGWEAMGGSLAGGPTAVSWSPGRIDVFARMSDNTLGHWYWAGAGWVYDDLGGYLTSDPDVASWGGGRLDVFARGPSNDLLHRYFSGSWGRWETLGGSLNSGPGAVSWGPGRIDVVAQAPNASLSHWWYQGS